MLGFSSAFLCFLVFSLFDVVAASPTVLSFDHRTPSSSLHRRAEPYFPPTPASCPICQQNYANINHCAAAAPVLANFTNVIFNPGAFIDVIKCTCTDTFQSAYPQCVDCFTLTNQTDIVDYNIPDLPSIIKGMQQICALEGTLLGNVSETNGEVTVTHTTATPNATSSAVGRGGHVIWGSVLALVISLITVG